MTASIHEITKEDVVKVLDIFFLTIFVRASIKSEETHQICELPMDISEYFQRRLSLKNHWLTNYYFLSQIAKCNYLFRSKTHLQSLGICEGLRLHQGI